MLSILRENKITFNLGQGYLIKAVPRKHDIEVNVLQSGQIVGSAKYVTDFVDVSCITHMEMEEKHINNSISDNETIGHAFIKFLLKFPSTVRKLEFRFILEVPDYLKRIIKHYNFTNNEENGCNVLVRRYNYLPSDEVDIPGIRFQMAVEERDFKALLLLLKVNAYWQEYLTEERLRILVRNSVCILAYKENELVGFARILTDHALFASLWDVVVSIQYQKQGVGTALMTKIFSDERFSLIKNWVIYTDTAKGLYKKFGFVDEREIKNDALMYKLRLQETPPNYMNELIGVVQRNSFFINLNSSQSNGFLFGKEGKRHYLPIFWKNVYDHGLTCESGEECAGTKEPAIVSNEVGTLQPKN